MAIGTQVSSAVVVDDVFTNTAKIDDGVTVVEPSASVSVAAPPAIAIKSPWSNQLFTERGQFVVTGRAWTADQTPAFPGSPMLRVVPDPKPPANRWYQIAWDALPGSVWFYVLEEALDPHFDQLTSYDSGPLVSTIVVFNNKAPGTYYYRAIAYNEHEGLWSDPIAVTVTAAATASDTTAKPLAAEALLYQPAVEVNIKPVGGADSWRAATSVAINAGGWWDWSYAWDLPEADDAQYVIQARARDQGGNYDPALVDTITVTIRNGKRFIYMPIIAKRWPPVPYPPTLTKPNDDGAGNYTLTWTPNGNDAGLPPKTGYRFQEATDVAFTNLTINEIRSSPQVFTNRNTGTYFYRVAGINSAGLGEWSNVVEVVVVRGYFDDFSNNASGWPRQVYRQDGRDVFDATYDNGAYRAKIMLNTDGKNNYRVGTVGAPWDNPYSRYEVQVQHRFAKAGDQAAAPDGGKGGLIFGGNGNLTTFYVLEWNFEGQCAVSKYVGAGSPISDPRFTTRVAFKNWGACDMHKGYDQVNTARVLVEGNRARAYINDKQVADFTDSDLASLHKVGFLTGAWERTPVDIRYDNFRVTPR